MVHHVGRYIVIEVVEVHTRRQSVIKNVSCEFCKAVAMPDAYEASLSRVLQTEVEATMTVFCPRCA